MVFFNKIIFHSVFRSYTYISKSATFSTRVAHWYPCVESWLFNFLSSHPILWSHSTRPTPHARHELCYSPLQVLPSIHPSHPRDQSFHHHLPNRPRRHSLDIIHTPNSTPLPLLLIHQSLITKIIPYLPRNSPPPPNIINVSHNGKESTDSQNSNVDTEASAVFGFVV